MAPRSRVDAIGKEHWVALISIKRCLFCSTSSSNVTSPLGNWFLYWMDVVSFPTFIICSQCFHRFTNLSTLLRHILEQRKVMPWVGVQVGVTAFRLITYSQTCLLISMQGKQEAKQVKATPNLISSLLLWCAQGCFGPLRMVTSLPQLLLTAKPDSLS